MFKIILNSGDYLKIVFGEFETQAEMKESFSGHRFMYETEKSTELTLEEYENDQLIKVYSYSKPVALNEGFYINDINDWKLVERNETTIQETQESWDSTFSGTIQTFG
jgi:hypothetical protein